MLVLRANQLVPSDRLIEELWGEEPPPTAHKMLHNQVSALRQTLGRNGRLETRGSAYRLNVGSGERDVDRFEDLLARARAQLDVDPQRALQTLGQALRLWRGPPLSDLSYEPFAQTEIARLEERRWAAFEAKVEAELALGRHADMVAEQALRLTQPRVSLLGQAAHCPLHAAGMLVGGMPHDPALAFAPLLEQGGREQWQPARLVEHVRDQRVPEYTAGPGAAVFIWDLLGTRRLGRPF